MNIKTYTTIIFLVLLCGLTINAISASEVNKNYKINTTDNISSTNTQTTTNTENTVKTNINTNQNVKTKTTPKIKTKVTATPVAVKHNKNKYFKVKILKKSNNAKIKNIKIQLKINNGNKYQNYTIKTNKYGIAKFNTKKLNKGQYKVKISSKNPKYSISKSSKIIIGNEYSSILKLKSKKVLKTKDIIGLKKVKRKDKTEVTIIFKKKPKHTIISKAKFYLKNKNTGKTLIQYDYCEFENGKWDSLDKDFLNKYCFVKVKVWYLKI